MLATGTAQADSFCCGVSLALRPVTYRFPEGSVVYSCEKALAGVLEAVAIKSVKFVANERTNGNFVVFYTDTYNGVWNEDQLCTEAAARATAVSYLSRLRHMTLDAIGQCLVPEK